MSKQLLFFGLLILFVSCNQSKMLTETQTDFEVLYASEYGGSGDGNIKKIYYDKQAFDLVWEELTGQPQTEAPKFNPRKEMIIRKDFDSHNTGGYQFKVEEVITNKNNLTVFYSVSKPSAFATDAITSPVLLIKVKKIIPVDKLEVKLKYK